MATVVDYVTAMRQRQLIIGRALGADLTSLDPQIRVLNLSLLALNGAIVKALIDAGVLTAAQLNAALNSARDDAWWSEPTNPADPPGG